MIAGYRTRMSSSVLSGRATFDKVVRMSVHYRGGDVEAPASRCINGPMRSGRDDCGSICRYVGRALRVH
ncbi:MAG: hypothetical protein ACI8RE_003225 [Ilumatobacter sp.]